MFKQKNSEDYTAIRDILLYLSKEKIISINVGAGRDGTLYKPNRKNTNRMQKIKDELHHSQDEIWIKVTQMGQKAHSWKPIWNWYQANIDSSKKLFLVSIYDLVLIGLSTNYKQRAKTPDHFSMIGGFNYLSGGAEENWTLDLLNAILRHHAQTLHSQQNQAIKCIFSVRFDTFRYILYIPIRFHVLGFQALPCPQCPGIAWWPRGWMVEPFADQLKTHTKFCPLNVSEGFSKGMCAVIAFKVYGFAPLLDHAVYGHNPERLLVASSGGGSASSAKAKQKILFARLLQMSCKTLCLAATHSRRTTTSNLRQNAWLYWPE